VEINLVMFLPAPLKKKKEIRPKKKKTINIHALSINRRHRLSLIQFFFKWKCNQARTYGAFQGQTPPPYPMLYLLYEIPR